MLAKRIIPCLDIKGDRTVKGIHFVNLRDAGDPVELGRIYARSGADELAFLDIFATVENRATFSRLVKRIARHLDIPFTVGGGINSTKDVEILLRAGADKITINSAAVRNPDLITELSREFGSQCIVVALDTKNTARQDRVYIDGGRTPAGHFTLDWAREVVDRGAGEILLTSMNHDGTGKGFALEITRKVSEMVPVPVIASGGAGCKKHFRDVFTGGQADAALAAGIFHFGKVQIMELKGYLAQRGIPVRR